MAISHCYLHVVVKNANFTLLLTSTDQEWQFHIATDMSSGQECQFHTAIGMSSGQEYQFPIHSYLHLLVQECQFHIPTEI